MCVFLSTRTSDSFLIPQENSVINFHKSENQDLTLTTVRCRNLLVPSSFGGNVTFKAGVSWMWLRSNHRGQKRGRGLFSDSVDLLPVRQRR